MRGKDIDMDLAKMQLIERPKKWYEELKITVTEKGSMIFSSVFTRKLFETQETRGILIYRTEDMKIIAVKADADSDFVIPNDRRINFTEFAEEMKRKGYGFPGKYSIEWNEHMNAWVGVLDEVAEAPQLSKKRK